MALSGSWVEGRRKVQDTPIFDALAELLNDSDRENEEGQREEELSESAGKPDEGFHEEGPFEGAWCSWCGTPISEGSPRFDWLTSDPVGGDSVEVTACSSEHLDLVQAQHPHPSSIEIEKSGPSGADQSAVGSSERPAPSAPVPAPPVVPVTNLDLS